jgi:hypothetical protein
MGTTGPVCASKHWNTAENIPTQCPKPSTDQCRRPLLHLRVDRAERKVVDGQGFMLDAEDD